MTTYEQPKDWIERHLVEDPGGLLACEPSRLDTLNDELQLARQANEAQHQQLAAALAAIKAKDEALRSLLNERSPDSYDDAFAALTIQPDDSALKAWLGEPRSYLYKFNSEFGYGTFWSHRPKHNGNDALEAIALYAPKGMK